ncbi:GNAT family N-acetyltransferase [Yimella sp. cx-573]|nr:GNAT family N-acetyltransferase [Yimella sp. cx-573]
MHFPDDVPVLTDGELTLRAHSPADAPRIIEFANDARSRQWIPLPEPYGNEQAEQFLDLCADHWGADPVHPTWAIELDGRFAGGVNLHPRGGRTWEVGYSLHPDARGRGVMTRTVRLVVDYCFERMDAQVVTWRCGAGNFASWRPVWAAGFTFDGVWRGMHRGSFGESDGLWLGSLSRGEWEDSRLRDVRAARPWWEPKLLRGDKVVLRPYRDGDELPEQPDAIAQRFSVDLQPRADEFARWLRERRRRMAIGDGIFWCIADASSDRILGHLQLTRLDVDFIRGSGSLGYWLLPEARGRGALTEALGLLIPHAFAPLTDHAGLRGGIGLHRLDAGTDEDNRASQRLLRRAGFSECATERSVLAHADRPPSGAISFELLASDDREAKRVQPLSVPTLRTERLVLREWTENDSPGSGDVTDDDARLFMANELPTTETFAAALRRRRLFADRGDQISWCITDPETGRVLGNINLFGIGEGTATNAEVGYWLWAHARGRGITAEALDAVLDHAFGQLGLTRVQAGTDLANVASQKILLRAGFRQWGADRQAYTAADGSITDGAYFELLSPRVAGL